MKCLMPWSSHRRPGTGVCASRAGRLLPGPASPRAAPGGRAAGRRSSGPDLRQTTTGRPRPTPVTSLAPDPAHQRAPASRSQSHDGPAAVQPEAQSQLLIGFPSSTVDDGDRVNLDQVLGPGQRLRCGLACRAPSGTSARQARCRNRRSARYRADEGRAGTGSLACSWSWLSIGSRSDGIRKW